MMQIDSAPNYIELATFEKNFTCQSELVQDLIDKEKRYGESLLGSKSRIALFDLDNTLIIGDISDAVYAQLLNNGSILPLSWKKYKLMQKENPVYAYVEVVRALEGISIEYYIQVLRCLLNSDEKYIYCEGDAVRVPKPNPVMIKVVSLLQDLHYSIFVISASNDILAKVTGSILFGIPISNIAGIRQKLSENKFTNTLYEPITVGTGKVAQYRLMSGDRVPMIVATDSILDFPIIEICDPDGIVIIVGQNEDVLSKAKEELPKTIKIHNVPGSIMLSFQ